MKIFDELGTQIETRWRDVNYREETFPDIAAHALAEAHLPERVTAWDTLRWLHSAPQIPVQQDVDAKFGNPPITLYCGPRFHIDVYFWVDGTTAIHQHSFAGAFQVLLGSSIHSRYTFQHESTINDTFLVGRVVFSGAELLKRGAIRKIIAGKEFIHSLFHLDRPSATITIRTHGLPTAQPQYSYLKPSLAVDPFFKETSSIKRLQSISMLLNVEHADAEAMICDLLAISDFQSTFSILRTANFLHSKEFEKALGLSVGKDRFQRLFDKARQRHGGLVDLIPPVLEEQERVEDLVKRRNAITSPEHRFFLALMLNVPRKEKMLDLVKQYFPEQEPVATVLDWVEELTTTKLWGSSEPNVLGVKDFDDEYLFVLECLLKGFSFQQAKLALLQEYPVGGPEGESKVERIVQSLRDSSIFKSILAD